MMLRVFFVLILAFSPLSAVLAQSAPGTKAQTLALDEQEQAMLGIEVQTLSAVREGGVGELVLRVAFAVDGEWVIQSPLAGIVHQVFVQEGSRVAAGDPLLVIRSAAMVDLQRDFLQARAEVTHQESLRNRDQRLKEAGSISERRWQDTQFNYQMAQAKYAGLRGQLLLAGMTDQELNELSIKMNIRPDIVMRAPADAIVVERFAHLGDQLDGSEVLVRLGDSNRLVLEGTVARAAALELREGARIALQDSDARADIVYVSGVIDPISQTLQVRAEPRDTRGLVPGQLTRWNILSGSEILSVPSNAVVKLDGVDTLFVANSSGFEVRAVNVRSTGSGNWIVLSGLQEGERIAVTGTAVLKGMSLGMGGGDE